jgi:pimeloyl-ACP methyl ester carboxylesterase
MRSYKLLGALLALVFAALTLGLAAAREPGLPGSQQHGLSALHRSGQTFLTWEEDTSLSGEGYHIYRHTQAITEANLDQARLLTGRWGPLPEGSSIFYTDRDREPGGSMGDYANMSNYVITELGPQLQDTTGLFVWTTKEDGDFYYAVTLVQDGAEALYAALTTPLTESVADPAPVLVWQAASGNGRVYTQFMDFETYNPTFERPIEGYGGLQYAYNYFVGLPTPEQCGGSLPDSLPIDLHIEGYGSRYEVHDSAPYFCALEVWNDDPRQSWYYGFSARYDYRTDDVEAIAPDQGPIVNYTEERLLRSIYDTLRDPTYHAYNLDPERVYVYGHSMGGSGALALAMRYPNVFAASFSSEPMTNYAASSVFADSDLAPKWGTQELNLPIENRGRYAAHLTAYDGLGVWDWQNHQLQLVERRSDEMALISLYHGASDDVIEWETQGSPAYEAFYQGLRAFSGAIVDAGHTWVGFEGMGPNLADYGGPFYGFQVRRDESVPALSNASGSSPVPPPGAGAAFNLNLEWSSSWHNWDGPPLDTLESWRISLRTTDGSDQRVDVTPRRLVNFKVTPGATYAWENHLVGGSEQALVEEGTVTADADGLITVPAVAVSAQGNRLVILAEGVSPGDLPPPGSPSGGDAPPPGSEDLQPPPSSAPESASGVVADFETGDDGWVTSVDSASTTVECAAQAGTAYRGTSALRIHYDVSEGGWGDCGRFFEAAQNWAAGSGLSFWLRSGQAGQTVTLMVFSGDPGGPTPFETTFELSDESLTDWVRLEFPWEDFARAPWADEGSLSELDPAGVTGFSFSFSGPENTVWIDEITLAGVEPPESSQIDTPESEPLSPQPEQGDGGGLGFCPCVLPLPLGVVPFFLVRKRKTKRT